MRESYGDVCIGKIEIRFHEAPALACLFIASTTVWGESGSLLPSFLLNKSPKGCETRNLHPLAAAIDLLEVSRILPPEVRHPDPEVSTLDILLVLRTGAGEFEVD